MKANSRLLHTFVLAGLLAMSFQEAPGQTQSYQWALFAGAGGGAGYADGSGGAAAFSNPQGVAVDGAGNVFVVDASNQAIRKVSPAGVVTTLAGGASGSVDGVGSAAQFSFTQQSGIAVDASGFVFVADTTNHTIRKISPTGLVTTFAGYAGLSGSADGAGNSARFYNPTGLAVDGAGNLYVADSSNHSLRKITPGGVVTLLAGSGQANVSGFVNGTGTVARFYFPGGVAADGSGNLYVADANNHAIRKVTMASGVVTTMAGGSLGSANGTGSAAKFSFPEGVAADAAGNVHVADTFNSTIRLVTPAGVVTTPYGSAGATGSTDAAGTAARFDHPGALAVDPASGNLFVADSYNHTLRKIAVSSGAVSTLAGTAPSPGTADGSGAAARFKGPTALALDASGNLFVADTTANSIRKITAAGMVSTLAGAAAGLNGPSGVAVDSATGNVYVTDTNAHKIRKITSGGAVSVLAGSGATGSGDGTGTAASFYYPTGIALDAASGSLNVADTYNNYVRIVTPAGVVTSLRNAASNRVIFSHPLDVLVAAGPTVFATQTGGGTHIVSVSATGALIPLAGDSSRGGSADGTGGGAKFGIGGLVSRLPLSMDAAGNIFAADSTNHTIRMITPAGEVSTIGGMAGASAASVGIGPAARFNTPSGIAISPAGILYVADTKNNRIVKGTPVPLPVITLEQPAGAFLTSGTSTVNFGSLVLGTEASLTFTLRNPGATSQTIGTITIDGTHAADFTVTTPPAATVPPGGSTTFAIRFTPGAAGARQAAIHVPSTGPTIIAFDLAVAGAGVTPGTGAVQVVISPADARVVGMQWQIDGGAWENSGTMLTGIAAGSHVVAFKATSGYITPASQNISVSINQTTLVTAMAMLQGQYLWTNFAGQPGGGTNADGPGLSAGLDGPTGVAVDAAGNVFIADGSDSTVRRMAPDGTVVTVGGVPRTPGGTDGRFGVGLLATPKGLATDAAGNAYIADRGSATIRKLAVDGTLSTVAGYAFQSGSADGIGSGARFNAPEDVAVDAAGNLYVADSYNNTVRKITPAGVVTTLAGTAGASGSTNGTGAAARFSGPVGVAVDAAGTVFVADYFNHTVRKITPAGVVTTLAGTAGASGSADGTGAAARFRYLGAMSLDAGGNLILADGDTVRRVTPAGVVTTLAGLDSASGYLDAIGSAARFSNPREAAADASGNVFVADEGNNVIRKVTPAGDVTTEAGRPAAPGSVDDLGAAARFSAPEGVAAAASGNLYVADNQTIRKITPAGAVSTLAGSPGLFGSADGTGAAARFRSPRGLAVDGAENVYVADTHNHLVRKVTPAGVVSTLAGMAGASGSTDGTGSAARFFWPAALVLDAAGNIFVSDGGNHTVRKVTAAGAVSTLAGTAGAYGFADGLGPAARFTNPEGIAIDGTGSLYLADSGANRAIRKIAPGGQVTTLAGASLGPGSADGIASGARFASPQGVAVDSAGNVFITDSNGYGGSAIRKMTPAGVVTTIGGSYDRTGFSDGLGTAARFNFRYASAGIAVTATGRLFVVDSLNNRISSGVQLADGTPVISVEQPVGGPLSDGASAPLFGSVNLGIGLTRTFTIRNQGNDNLTSLSVTKDGADATDFVINTSGMSIIVQPGGSTTFTVVFSPGAKGARSAALHVTSNAGGGNPFDVGVGGTGVNAQETWRQLYFGTPNSSGNAADLFDYDKDGLVNLIEFAFGLNPVLGSSNQLPQGQIIGGNFVISFTQPAGTNGVTYGAEWNAGLTGAWSPIADTGSGSLHIFSVPIGANSRLFVRLKVTGL